MVTRTELIKKYLDFFKAKNHAVIPSASLVPQNDPTVLFTTAGMHPLVPYLLGQKHPLGKRLASAQKCIRTGDIEEVGDATHHTFFEMLGNWSLGDYWKKESIEYSFEFLTKVLKIPIEKLAVTVFEGDKNAPQDAESEKIWLSLGISKERIARLGKEDNWWGPAGQTGPCGPDTEIFYWSSSEKAPKKFDPKNKGWVEIWNNVFMEYKKDKRLILVDGMHCLYDKDFNLNNELYEEIKKLNTHYIVVVNNYKEKAEKLVKNTNPNYETNWGAFSLEEKQIKKDNPEYFKKVVEKYGLSAKEIIYFDHDEKNVETAKKLGILSMHYKDNKSIKKFLEENLYAFFPSKQRNVDTGMGVERTLAALNGLSDNYLTGCFSPIIEELEKLCKKNYKTVEHLQRIYRIMADHIKAAVFMAVDGVTPSNTGRGYVLRRLVRRTVMWGKRLNLEEFTEKIAKPVFTIYDTSYPELKENKDAILEILNKEEKEFNKTLEKGLIIFNHKVRDKEDISGKDAFLLYQSYGFPIELIKEECKEREISLDEKGFYEEYRKHQELSRSTSAGMFKSGLADNSEATTRLHTATHLLNEALRIVLGSDVKQKGSNITPERLRFDFSFPRKMTPEEVTKVEKIVNEKIKASLNVTRSEIKYKTAIEEGAQGEFGHKYPEIVSIYTIADKKEKKGWFSKEICTGPHVKNTSEIGTFKIVKEESVSAGIRRIKAIVN